MKNIFLVLVLVPIFALAQDKEEKSGVAESAKSVVSSVVKFGKEVLSGVSDGVTEGRKTGESGDGAIIVSNQNELEQFLEVSILSKTADGEKSVNVELGFKNSGYRPVRVINLKDKNAIIVVDKDGYATGLSSHNDNPFDITVPEQAAVKQMFNFNVPEESAFTIRIWGKQYQL